MQTRDPQDWRWSNIGRLMNNAVARFEERVLQLLAEKTQSQVRLTHLSLTRNLDLTGTRSTELARRAAMTKQAMSEIVSQCEAIGLIHREADPSDARAKIVLFTDKGLLWLKAFRQAVKDAEDEMEQELGSQAMLAFKKALEKYNRSETSGFKSPLFRIGPPG